MSGLSRILDALAMGEACPNAWLLISQPRISFRKGGTRGAINQFERKAKLNS